nr:hypothetical protein [Tanacetum cinerariifolium]
MHAVPPLMIGNYMPPKSDFRIDELNFTYGLKQSTTSEFVSEPKVWSDAPIIEEYESDSDVEHVTIPLKEQEKPSFVFVNTVEHIKIPRQNVKEQHTCSQNPKPNNRDWDSLMSKRTGLGYGFTEKACFVCGNFSHLIRYYDFHEKRMAKQIEWNEQKVKAARQNFTSQAALTSTARKVNTTRPKVNENGPRQNVYKSHSPIRRPFNKTTTFTSQAALTSTARKVNTTRPKVNENGPRQNVYKSHSPIRRPFNKTTPKANFAQHKVNTTRPKVNENGPRQNVYKSHSPIRRPFNKTTPKANFAQHKVNTTWDKSVSVVGGKWETAVKASAGCNWRCKRHYWNRVSKYNSGSKFKECVDIKDPLV